MQAILLAAGEGKRLRPLTATRPKVMIPVGGAPLIEHVVRALVANGIRDITLVVGYKRERIQTHFQDGDQWGADIRYAVQDRQLGTGHALAVGLETAGPQEDFLVLPGDNYVTTGLVKSLVQAKGDLALVSTRSTTPSKYGVLEVQGDTVHRIQEKPSLPTTRLISTGIYRLPPDFGGYISADDLALTDVVNRTIQNGHSLTHVPVENAWQDIVYPWDLLQVNHRILNELDDTRLPETTEEGVMTRGPVHVGDGTILRSGSYLIGPIRIGAHCDIGPNVVIRGPATIGDHSTIGPFSDLENVTLMDNTVVDTGCVLRHTILDQGARLGPRVSADRGPAVFDIEGEFQHIHDLGAVIGGDAFVGANTVLEPGAVIGVGATVAANRTVRRVPDGAHVV